MTCRPFEGLATADRAADRDQFRNPQALDHPALDGDDVADRDQRETHRVGATGQGIERRRTGRALATAEDVDADDERTDSEDVTESDADS